jgi:transposase
MAYSDDLRERVVRAIQKGERTQRQIAADFEVSRSFVEETWRRYRETGSWQIKTWQPGPKAQLNEQADTLRAHVKAHPDMTLEARCEQVLGREGKPVSPSTMSRTLKRLGITNKKR